MQIVFMGLMYLCGCNMCPGPSWRSWVQLLGGAGMFWLDHDWLFRRSSLWLPKLSKSNEVASRSYLPAWEWHGESISIGIHDDVSYLTTSGMFLKTWCFWKWWICFKNEYRTHQWNKSPAPQMLSGNRLPFWIYKLYETDQCIFHASVWNLKSSRKSSPIPLCSCSLPRRAFQTRIPLLFNLKCT